MPEKSEDFYKNLPGFSEFSGVTDLSLYSPLPDDWHIVIADITGSTGAIKEGRYKDVNMMGAACIMAVLNALPQYSIPYVFGGDGATLAVPDSAAALVKRELGATRSLAQKQFGLDLRVGIVPIRDVRDAGADVLVAKFQLSSVNAMAMFTGGGVQLVDGMIKDTSGKPQYSIPIPADDAAPDLKGLSCRWEPLKSNRGMMLSILVHARGKTNQENIAIYREVIDCIDKIFNSDVKAASPVSAQNMVYKWPPKGMISECKLFALSPNRIRKYFWISFTSLVQFVLEKFDLSFGGYNAPQYREELRVNSDFRRFDDTLRMILDCTPDIAGALEEQFHDLHSRERIVYGVHRSGHALMTCLVFSLDKGEHVHFIDGSDGGFTAAAIQLKAQIQELSQKTR